MGGRFGRSWEMVKHSAAILTKDRELMIFPLLSLIAAGLALLSFMPLFVQGAATPEEQNPFVYVALGTLYLAEFFVVFFFNTALVGAAMIRMDGGDPTIRDGLRIAWSKAGKILGYAIIAATVGVVLRAVGERFGVIGRLLSGLIGVAWTVASFLTIPVLVSRDVGPVEAVRESGSLLKQTWGENVISNAGIGVVFMAFYALVFIVGGLLLSLAFSTESTALIIGVIVTGIVAMLVIGLAQAALQGIFSAVLYQFAAGGQNTAGFPSASLSNAFAPKVG